MNALIRQPQLIIIMTCLSIIMACEHALEPAFDLDDVLFLEDTFTEAEQLYRTAGFDLAIEKFNLVLRYDLQNCFEDAYFYLANIYLMQDNPNQARNTLIQGKKRYSKLGDEGCVSGIIRRFDSYLERMSPDSLFGPPTFVPFDEPPVPIGGFAAIQSNLEYPQDAIDMGIEGEVIVKALIDCFGHACLTQVISGGQLPSMDVAARKAAKSVMWKPAMQRNQPLRVFVTVPVIFRLSN